MLSPATLSRRNREAAERAAQRNEVPFVFEDEDLPATPPFPTPDLGDHRPDGWTLVETYLVDSSGFGTVGEPALTVDQFARKIARWHDEPGTYGWAVIGAGQFQVRVGRFVRDA